MTSARTQHFAFAPRSQEESCLPSSQSHWTGRKQFTATSRNFFRPTCQSLAANQFASPPSKMPTYFTTSQPDAPPWASSTSTTSCSSNGLANVRTLSRRPPTEQEFVSAKTAVEQII